MANIGFIGLGIMGAPMAGHLINDGHTLFTNTVCPTPSALVEAGARVCLNGAEVASQADIVFIMVPDTPQVDEVLFGKDGVASSLTAGKIVVDNLRYAATQLKQAGIRLLIEPINTYDIPGFYLNTTQQ
ncbi:MAG: NAD(P)-dependent oxidoreductase, partial [Massilia sp.]|nr:NAD(P)-dependent oxidoreductase [Massilia sp.]